MKSLLVLCALLAVGAAEGRAGTYTQYACSAGGAGVSTDGLRFSATGGTALTNKCGEQGGYVAELLSKEPSSGINLTYDPPPDTTLLSASLDRTLSNVGTPTNSTYDFAGTTDRCAPGGDCVATRSWGAAMSSFAVSLGCPSTGCTGFATPTVTFTGFIFTLRDDSPPRITSTSGFLAGGEVSGTVQAPFAATDAGGGVFEAELVLDGVGQGRFPVDENGGRCRTPFTYRVPCPLAATGTASLDTTALKDGEHTVALRVHDVTLDNYATSEPATIRVVNGAAAGPTAGSSAGAAAGLRIAPRRRAKVLTRRFDRRTVLRGRLLDAAGAPLGGVEVGAYAAPDTPRGKERLVAKAVTDAAGAYRLVLPPGPSRRVSIRPTSGDGGGGAWTFRTRVVAPLRLLPSRTRLRNGDKLVLTAYLAGRRAPRGSADVAFQVLIGRQWRTFAKAAFDKRGLAQVEHRFRVTYQRITYRFRALTLKRRSFPYDNARSRPVAVRVN